MRNDAVRFNDSIEDLCQLYEERRKNDVRLSAYDISLAELSGDPAEVYRSLIKAELNLFPGRDYQNGSAKRDDELLLNSGTNGVILTAEHASNHRRRRKRMLYIRHTKVAEWG